jgi:hypothetical protein
MRDAMANIHSDRALSKMRPRIVELLRAFGFTKFAQFSSWRPPRS